MAKLMAKKRLAETTEVIEAPPKRLKLVLKERNIRSHLEQTESTSDETVILQQIHEIRNFYPLRKIDAEFLYHKCFQMYRKQQSEFIKSELLRCLRSLSVANWLPASEIDFRQILKEFIELSILEDGNVLGDLLGALNDLLHHYFNDSKMLQNVLLLCQRAISNLNVHVKCAAVELLASIFIRKHQNERKDGKESGLMSPKPRLKRTRTFSTSCEIFADLQIPIEKFLIDAIGDQEIRVRISAARALLQFITNKLKIPFEYYGKLCETLNDEGEEVRSAALQLVWYFSQIYPEKTVLGHHAEMEIQLVDDAFTRLCNAINDCSVEVRRQAADFLGRMENISQKFLDQTLDKKLMSALKFNKTMRMNQRAPLLSEWATGRRFGADAPVEGEDDSVSIIPSGACGAFVSGLEDEFMVVREASVNAIGALAVSRPKFAEQALDFIADMFNDEIEEVRLAAIRCLRRICAHIRLNEDQTEIVLNVLDDFSPDSREALRDLLSFCRFESKQCLKLACDALLTNLKRYPNDKMSIWKCFKHLGWNHGALTLTLVPDLLGFHEYFDLPERDVEDPGYCCILILIFNAAYHCPPIKSMLKRHHWTHFQYLKESKPDLVPKLNIIATEDSEESSKEEFQQSFSLLKDIVKKMAVLSNVPRTELRSKLIKFLHSLNKVFNLENELKSVAELLEFLLEIDKKLLFNSLETVDDFSTNLEILELLKITYAIELAFANIPDGILRHAKLMRLKAFASLANQNPGLESAFSDFLTNLRLDPLISNWPLMNEFENFFDVKNSASDILTAFENYSYVLSSAISENEILEIRRRRAVIEQPPPESDQIVKFNANLIGAIHLEAELMNFDTIEDIRVLLTYPDQSLQVLRPRRDEFKAIESDSFRLRTRVLLSHSVWTDAASVELSIVRLIPEDALVAVENDLKWIVCSNVVRVKVLPKSRC